MLVSLSTVLKGSGLRYELKIADRRATMAPSQNMSEEVSLAMFSEVSPQLVWYAYRDLRDAQDTPSDFTSICRYNNIRTSFEVADVPSHSQEQLARQRL